MTFYNFSYQNLVDNLLTYASEHGHLYINDLMLMDCGHQIILDTFDSKTKERKPIRITLKNCIGWIDAPKGKK